MNRRNRALATIVTLLVVTVSQLPAFAASVNSASFSGGAGTASVAGTLYAKEGGALTLTVVTSNDTRCVEVTGAHVGKQIASPNSTWRFAFTAGSGEGEQSVTVTARPNVNPSNGNCSGPVGASTASYALDNTGPSVTAALSPAPNTAGWNRSNVSIAWSATDSGSGLGSGPIPANETVDASTAGTTKTSTASDRVGNSASGSVTVKLDKDAPSITGSRSPAANTHGWNNSDVAVSFTCEDPLSGIKSCTGGSLVSLTGSLPGVAVDNADNTTSTSLTVQIDKQAPTISGAATTSPHTSGWYRGDVAVAWTCADTGGSGIDGACPGNRVVTGEGADLFASASVGDRAGNTTSGSVTGIKIDRTAPVTTASAPLGWINSDASVTFTATDNLSGVASTYFEIDGGAAETGTSVSLGEGNHTVTYWSVDDAGNAEGQKTVEVKVDKTAPTISHSLNPVATNGWHKTDVTVTFDCDDTLSGLSSCTQPQAVTDEGQNQQVTGTTVDNAGNEAQDTATVNLDRTAPTITGSRSPGANANGWNNAHVTVSFTCTDALSGIASCSQPTTLSTDGADQSVSGTAVDVAGNSAPGTVSQINIDRTPPTLSGAPTTSANPAGWYTGDVTVTWTCTDELSGIHGVCPSGTTLTGEGDDLSASASVSDRADNTTNTTVSGIKIDRNAPATSATVPDPLASGWYADDVEVTLTGVDPLSGVSTTYYQIGDGDPQEYSVPFTMSQRGTSTIAFWSVDHAGNVEDANGLTNRITLKIDGEAPRVTTTRLPTANSYGWNHGPVVVTVTCNDPESGIAEGGCPEGAMFDDEGADQRLTGTARDNAGNESAVDVGPINIDLTAPTVSASTTPPPDPESETDWLAGPVRVSVAASDALSGIATAEYRIGDGEWTVYVEPFTVQGTGEHTVEFRAEDKAGNPANGQIDVKIDDEDPTITGSRSPEANSFGWNNGDVTVSFECVDDHSGIAGCTPDEEVLHQDGAGQSVTGNAVDNAGNGSSATVSDINIDTAAPTLTGAATTAPNAAGWYRGDVTVRWTPQDGLAGVDESTVPLNSVITGEGNDLSTTATVMDQAGNEGTGTVSGVNIDRTPPTINVATVNDDGTPRTASNGWFDSAVRVRFGCWDALSGVAAGDCPEDTVVITDGAGHQVPGQASDRAGNTADVTVSGINIDSQAPITTATADCGEADWCKGQAQVTLEATDQEDLSGVARIHYRIGSGDWQSTENAAPAITVTLTGSGTATVRFKAEDHAGNTETEKAISLNYDDIAPIVTATSDPLPNAQGWNKQDVTVTFSATDEAGGSGIVGGSITAPVTVDAETSGQTVTGQALDLAGNRGETSVTIKLDETAPTVAGSATGDPNVNGWYSGPVTVNFTCTDGLSGCVNDTRSVTLSQNGVGQSESWTASDRAGNEASGAVTGINIDAVGPTITGVTPENGSIHTLGAVPALACTATDGNGSGLSGSCNVTVTGGTVNGVGTFSFTATATDLAGNTAVQTGTYQVQYRLDGIGQPINDTNVVTATSAQKSSGPSVFKAGSTVPVKFQLKKADGTPVQAAALPAWIAPAKGSAMTAAVDETVFSDPATSGSTFRWDPSDQHYIYNWGTPKNAGGHYWRVGMQLDDGRTYTVTIGLR